MIAYVLRRTPVDNPADAEDVLHDALVKILDGEVDLPEGREHTWSCLLATLRNVARNHFRYEDRRRAEPLDQVPTSREWVQWGRERGWRICAQLERRQVLGEALERLTPDQREVIELRYFQGWTVREVAEHRGTKLRAVKKLAAGALGRLEAVLDGRFGAE